MITAIICINIVLTDSFHNNSSRLVISQSTCPLLYLKLNTSRASSPFLKLDSNASFLQQIKQSEGGKKKKRDQLNRWE